MGKKRYSKYNDWKYKPVNINISDNSKAFAKVEIISPKTLKWSFYANEFKKYLADHQTLLSEKEIQKMINNPISKNIEVGFSFMDYMNRESAMKLNNPHDANHVWHYNNQKMYDGKILNNISTQSRKSKWDLINKDNVPKINKKSFIWSGVISIKEKELADLTFKNQHLIIDRYLRAVLPFGIDAIVSYHDNTAHPHIHFMAYQNENVSESVLRKNPKIHPKSLKNGLRAYSYLFQKNKKEFSQFLTSKHELRQNFTGELLQRYFLKEFLELDNKIDKYQFERLIQEEKELVEELADKILKVESDDPMILKFKESFYNFNNETDKYWNSYTSFENKEISEGILTEINLLREEARIKFMNQILKFLKEVHFMKENELKRFKYNEWLDKNQKSKNISNNHRKKLENKYINKPSPIKKMLPVNKNGGALAKMFEDMSRDQSDNFQELKKLINNTSQSI